MTCQRKPPKKFDETQSSSDEDKAKIDTNKCFKCDVVFAEPNAAIGCNECPRWFHPGCMPPCFRMYIEGGKLPEDIPFECDFCMK